MCHTFIYKGFGISYCLLQIKIQTIWANSTPFCCTSYHLHPRTSQVDSLQLWFGLGFPSACILSQLFPDTVLFIFQTQTSISALFKICEGKAFPFLSFFSFNTLNIIFSYRWILPSTTEHVLLNDHSVLVCLGCCNKTPLTWWLKQQTFISHGSGDWEV